MALRRLVGEPMIRAEPLAANADFEAIGRHTALRLVKLRSGRVARWRPG